VRLREQFPAAKLTPVIADIRDRERIRRVFERFRPPIVFHAAAHKHVPLMEDNPEEAVTNNVFGTTNVVDAALEVGTERLVLISTDKAASPTSVMGATKRLAGEIVRAAAAESGRAFVVVRFGNVLGSRGSVVPLFKRQIEHGGPVTVTHPDVKRFFMTIPEAVHLVLQAGGLGKGGELYVLNMGEPVRIVDLARDLIRLSGFSEHEMPITFIGLKPGEKLEEELWERGAKVEPTSVAEVLRVVEREFVRGQELAKRVGSGLVIDPSQIAGEILRAIRTGRPALSDREASPRRDFAVLSPVLAVPGSPARLPGVARGDFTPRAQEPAGSVQQP
jgi:FlaA1/EpsC-like NDP-sugar epimerase